MWSPRRSELLAKKSAANPTVQAQNVMIRRWGLSNTQQQLDHEAMVVWTVRDLFSRARRSSV